MTPEEIKAVVEQVLTSQALTDSEPVRLRAALEASLKEIQYLRDQLAMAQALLEAKDETLSLLRGGYNRPN